MKPLGERKIRLAEIGLSDRLRPIDDAHAALIAEAIRTSGRMLQRILVRFDRGATPPYRLIAGGHRYRAAQMLGWEWIEVDAVEASDDEARLAEIDENIVRHDLNPLDRAVFLHEREQVYLRLHPETRRGGDHGNQHVGGKKRQTEIVSFSQDTAKRCGITDRTVRNALSIAKGLDPALRARIAGTALAKNQSELLALVKVEPSRRLHVVDLLLTEGATVRTVAAAARLLDGAAAPASDDREKKVAALRKAWNRAGAAARRQWLEELAADGQLLQLRATIDGVLALKAAPARPDRSPADRSPAGRRPVDPLQIDLEEAIAAQVATAAQAGAEG